jgi:hypothetical protein
MSEEDYNSSSSEDMEKVYSFDNFISIHLDYLLDIFYDFENNFRYNPYFLYSLKFEDFILFLYKHLHENFHLKAPKTSEYFSFIFESEEELDLSYNIISRYFYSKFWEHNCNISKSSWYVFCYNNSLI